MAVNLQIPSRSSATADLKPWSSSTRKASWEEADFTGLIHMG